MTNNIDEWCKGILNKSFEPFSCQLRIPVASNFYVGSLKPKGLIKFASQGCWRDFDWVNYCIILDR